MPLRWRVFAAFAAAHFLSYFLRNANAVLAGDLARDLALSADQLGLMTSSYLLAFAAVQLPFGSLLDRFGARVTTPLLMLAAVAGSLLFAVGDAFWGAAAGRALIGLGTAGVLMGALKALSGHFSQKSFGAASGALVAFGSLGALLAATPLAAFAGAFGWRAAFGWGGVAMGAAALGVVLFGRAAPANAAVLEAEPSEPPPESGFGLIFRDPRFWRMGALGFALGGANFAWQSLWAGPYLTGAAGLGSVATGNVLLAFGVGVTSGYLLSGWFGARVGVERTLVGAGVVAIAAQLALALRPEPGFGILSVLFTLFGLTVATGFLLFTQTRGVFPLSHTGRAVTALNLAMFGGGFVQQWLLGALLEALAGGGDPLPWHYGALFAASAGLTLAALLVYLPELRGHRARRDPQN